MQISVKYYQLLINSDDYQNGYDSEPKYLRGFSKEELYEECFEHIDEIIPEERYCIPVNAELHILNFETDEIIDKGQTFLNTDFVLSQRFKRYIDATDKENHLYRYNFDLDSLSWKEHRY